jgi:hypothetical protein
MKFTKTLIIILSFMLGLGQKAWSLSAFDQAAYETSKALCSPLASQGKLSQSFSNFHLYVLTSSLKETDQHIAKVAAKVMDSEKKSVLTDYKTAGVLGDLLHSEGFRQAMVECFPDEADHHRFVLTLILAEKLGNFVVIAGTAVGVSLSVRYLIFKFPQVFNLKVLKYFFKTGIVLSPLSLAASVDLKSQETYKKQSLDQQIQRLETDLKREDLNPSEKQQLTLDLRTLVLRKALESLN